MQTAIGHRQRIRRAIRHLETWLTVEGDARLPVGELADIACMSPYHFLRVYARKTGETPAASLRRWRLARARDAIASGRTRSITDAAFDAGYENPSAFSRAFLQAFGVTPSAVARQGAAPAPVARLSLARLPEFALVGQVVGNGWRDVVPAYDELMGMVVARDVPRDHVAVWSVLTPQGELERAALLATGETASRLPFAREVRPMRDYLAVSGETKAAWARLHGLGALGQIDREAGILMRYGNDPAYTIRDEQTVTLYVPLRKDAGPLGFAV